jgi:acetylcholinesterase
VSYCFSSLTSILNFGIYLEGDLSFHAPRRLFSQAAANASVKSYAYQFTQPQPDSGIQGVFHNAILPYLYGAPTVTKRSEDDNFLSVVIMDYWISFANSLDPNDGLGTSRAVWEEYTSEKQVRVLFPCLSEDPTRSFSLGVSAAPVEWSRDGTGQLQGGAD